MNVLVLVRSDGRKPFQSGDIPLGELASLHVGGEVLQIQPKPWKPTAGITHRGIVLMGVKLDHWHKLQELLRTGAVHSLLDLGDGDDTAAALNSVFLRINPLA